MSYLWRVALDCPQQQIADLARQRLVWLHVRLAPELQPRCVAVRSSFITCAPAARGRDITVTGVHVMQWACDTWQHP